jgi:hypothetical protein
MAVTAAMDAATGSCDFKNSGKDCAVDCLLPWNWFKFGPKTKSGAKAGGGGQKKKKGESKPPEEGDWKTPEEWAKHDHDNLRDRLRKEKQGFESGRHDEFSGSMEKELRNMADEADAKGDLPEYGQKMREWANTYGKRARGARHKGGTRR